MNGGELVRVDETTYRVGEVVFSVGWGDPVAGSETLRILKEPRLIEQYAALLRRRPFARVVEVGVRQGGSTALLASLGEIETLVAIDLTEDPPDDLVRFVDGHGLGDVIRLHFATDQADRAAIAAVAADEFGTDPIDLVIDDASHLLGPTTACFETLFPRLAPGGVYIIEDWSWQHRLDAAVHDALTPDATGGVDAAVLEVVSDPDSSPGAAFRRAVEGASEPSDDDRPLMALFVRLLLALAVSDEIVADVQVDSHWVTITRGSGAIDAASFAVDDIGRDFRGLLGPTI